MPGMTTNDSGPHQSRGSRSVESEEPEPTRQDTTPPTTFVRASVDIDPSELPPHRLAKRLDNGIKQIERGETDCDWLDAAVADLLADAKRLRELAAQYEYEVSDGDSA
jgi:hypothetical protein